MLEPHTWGMHQPARTVKHRPTSYGVFVWNADPAFYDLPNVYGRKERVKGAGVCTFVTEKGAQAKADRLNADPEHYARTNGRGFVVRAVRD